LQDEQNHTIASPPISSFRHDRLQQYSFLMRVLQSPLPPDQCTDALVRPAHSYLLQLACIKVKRQDTGTLWALPLSGDAGGGLHSVSSCTSQQGWASRWHAKWAQDIGSVASR
jgi:hypothetical protein